MKHAFFLLTTILASAFGMRCAGQEFAVKTNVLYDATMTINLGAELEVAPKWSVELSGNFNGWNMGNGRRWKHWLGPHPSPISASKFQWRPSIQL